MNKQSRLSCFQSWFSKRYPSPIFAYIRWWLKDINNIIVCIVGYNFIHLVRLGDTILVTKMDKWNTFVLYVYYSLGKRLSWWRSTNRSGLVLHMMICKDLACKSDKWLTKSQLMRTSGCAGGCHLESIECWLSALY